MIYKHIEELHDSFRGKKRLITARLRDFRNVPADRYFYELIYCLMTPQSTAVNAGKVQKRLEELNYREEEIDPLPLLFDKRHYIRFHRTKAERIAGMKRMYGIIHPVVTGTLSAQQKREWLVANVQGMSYKEATHFLRNIGLNDGLAILDRHILKNLKYHGVIRQIPPALTKKRYLAIERKFLAFAAELSISTDELDLLFWSREAGAILK